MERARVILAAEHPQVQYFLSRMVEEEMEASIVGQAENATKALSLVRNLKPDVAIIDCYLPYVLGLDKVRLSRVSGLDTARIIADELPSTRVILLGNLDTEVLSGNGLNPGAFAFVSPGGTKGNGVPLTLERLYQKTKALDSLVFADIELKPEPVAELITSGFSDKAILFGALGIIAGWFLIAGWFAPVVGAPLALAGIASVALGLVTKLTSRAKAKRGMSVRSAH